MTSTGSAQQFPMLMQVANGNNPPVFVYQNSEPQMVKSGCDNSNSGNPALGQVVLSPVSPVQSKSYHQSIAG